MATQREDARHAYEQVHRSVRAGDELLRDVSRQVGIVLERSGIGVLDVTHRPRLMGAVEGVLTPVFGRTRVDAVDGQLTRLVLTRSDEAGVSHYRRAWDELNGTMRRQDPVVWQRVQRHLASAPFDERDGLMKTYRLLYGPHIERERLARSLFVDPERRWVDGRGYQLSDRVWQDGQGIRQSIDDRIRLAIRNGEDALVVARDLERYLNPDHAPVRYLTNGRILRRVSPPGSVTGMPRDGHGSTATRRLMRTEISRVNAIATQTSAQDVPGIRGLRFRLSGSHPGQDSCNPLAEQDLYGLGAGIYPIDSFPAIPVHPQCLCLCLHVHHSREDTRRQIVDKYRHLAGVAA